MLEDQFTAFIENNIKGNNGEKTGVLECSVESHRKVDIYHMYVYGPDVMFAFKQAGAYETFCDAFEKAFPNTVVITGTLINEFVIIVGKMVNITPTV